jgi:hypothetical protein
MRRVGSRQTVPQGNTAGSAIGIQTQSCTAEVRQCKQDQEPRQNRDEFVAAHGQDSITGEISVHLRVERENRNVIKKTMVAIMTMSGPVSR